MTQLIKMPMRQTMQQTTQQTMHRGMQTCKHALKNTVFCCSVISQGGARDV